jgi:hypothetical protein
MLSIHTRLTHCGVSLSLLSVVPAGPRNRENPNPSPPNLDAEPEPSLETVIDRVINTVRF